MAVNLVFGGLLLLWAAHASAAGWGLFAALGLGGAARIAASIVALGVPPLGLAGFEVLLLAATEFQHIKRIGVRHAY